MTALEGSIARPVIAPVVVDWAAISVGKIAMRVIRKNTDATAYRFDRQKCAVLNMKIYLHAKAIDNRWKVWSCYEG
ncbi:MAG TPA: hypothetical protein VJW77_12340 [Terriglobia bacterium]|nr:hypothetical protein [Terriglobia bacterium]